MRLVDAASLAVLAFVGVRLVGAARWSTGAGRARVLVLWRGVRARHVLLAVPMLVVVAVVAAALVQVPGLDLGWWTALGGVGNPVMGGTTTTEDTALTWLVPLVFVVLLLPGLALFAEAEERSFRRGAEHWSTRRRVGRALAFGLVHLVVGVPVGVALALSIGGGYFTWCYLRAWRATGSQAAAVAESTRAHLAYNAVVVVLVASAVVAGAFG